MPFLPGGCDVTAATTSLSGWLTDEISASAQKLNIRLSWCDAHSAKCANLFHVYQTIPSVFLWNSLARISLQNLAWWRSCLNQLHPRLLVFLCPGVLLLAGDVSRHRLTPEKLAHRGVYLPFRHCSKKQLQGLRKHSSSSFLDGKDFQSHSTPNHGSDHIRQKILALMDHSKHILRKWRHADDNCPSGNFWKPSKGWSLQLPFQNSCPFLQSSWLYFQASQLHTVHQR